MNTSTGATATSGSTRDFTWRKSSFSGQESDCVEVRATLDALRDSKRPGPTLRGDVRGLVAFARDRSPA